VGDRVQLEVGSQLLWPDHCVQGSKGAEFVPGLETKKIIKTFQKGIEPQIDSYSGLYDNGNLRETGLRLFLKEHKVTEVHIVGLATEYTVKFTALDCKREGFEVVVVLDGCRSLEVKPGDTEKAIREMKNAGIRIK
jgi:nicotinamidase/pyrazinamidase